MLMPYFARYLLSRFFNRGQGKEVQEWSQYFPSRLLQNRKVQFLLHLVLGVKQPSHLFLSRTYPIQSRQLIPHGAMLDILVLVVMPSISVFLPNARTKRARRPSAFASATDVACPRSL